MSPPGTDVSSEEYTVGIGCRDKGSCARAGGGLRGRMVTQEVKKRLYFQHKYFAIRKSHLPVVFLTSACVVCAGHLRRGFWWCVSGTDVCSYPR